MIKFLIKKAFFDMWDNLFRVFFMNIGFILIFLFLRFVPPLFKDAPIFFYLLGITGVLILFVYTGVVSSLCRRISDNKRIEFDDIKKSLFETYSTSIIFVITTILYITMLTFVFSAYIKIESSFALIGFSFVFWINLFIMIALQYFYPIQSRLDKSFIKIMRRLFILFLDNVGFSIALFIGTLFILVLSFFTLFFLFGFANILIWLNVGLKLRLYKYDHFEKNPGANKRIIPWDDLLQKDKEIVGKRSLQDMIFPWRK